MKIPLALLADAANLAIDGKLNILGQFDILWAREFPATHPELVLVIQGEAGPAEFEAEKNIEIRLLNADGHLVTQVGGSMSVPKGQSGYPVIWPGLFLFRNLKFESPGDYTFVVLINGETKREVRLAVRVAQQEEQHGNAKH